MKELKIMDCTLRDGANVVGKGFDADLTRMMLEGLIESNIKTIEYGNCLGLGAYEADHSIAPLTDLEYLELAQPYLNQAEIGMFMGAKNATAGNIELAARYGLNFLRIGANAGDGECAKEGIRLVKKNGMVCRYSLMKAYILPPDELAREAKMLEACGLDEITIMDSAGTMTPDEVSEYVDQMSAAVQIPIAFHGHNNLGLSVANALAAQKAGATVFDAGLLGMARSAGNCATELAVAAFQRKNMMHDVRLYQLLTFIEDKLAPAMEKYNYRASVSPLDLIYGMAGCHSSFAGRFEQIAKEKGVPLYPLIVKVSAIDRKNPSEELIRKIADGLK
ncbi:4-hydroxy-2-oxovalerate aldolase [Diplocloster agilis]|uniref:4-hydroxy-2-oxovalerate aldolase n=1 Tax=Diplocloster agilis TaxID=2850323 RepID=UPI000820E76D|nr:4-hydroxy-2-oxovalerate aldolase [Suonthocola fibrivorans]MCU6736651.1 4-hydroxy-2-oxovalerate aldolase [Suonthocola fibrivorans]SCJ92532.1 4-hydroxy-2-oxovalerate aldolase 4 [uncultured Clostridium sp.]